MQSRWDAQGRSSVGSERFSHIEEVIGSSPIVPTDRRLNLDVAQLVAHLVRDQEVAGSSPVIQTKGMARVFPVIPFIKYGELSEWLKEPASKTGVRQRTGGSNPSLTAVFSSDAFLSDCIISKDFE